jgi:DNA polymerase IV
MDGNQRQILHADMDAFYASVEQHDDADLRGRPVIVGGDLRRGVVSACSYQARAFGVHSAQPLAVALRLCPQAVVRPVRMGRYREVSKAVMAIFAAFTDRVEALSIDEAFLDVTGCERLFGTAREIAVQIRSRVRDELGLAVSIGIAPNKFLAKLASQKAKPDGLLQILPEAASAFLRPLPVADLWGVGGATADRLRVLGIVTVNDLLNYPEARLVARLGRAGSRLLALARGDDRRPVATEGEIKSVSNEETFAVDLTDLATIQRELHALVQRVAARLRHHGLRGRQVSLKVRYDDFTTVSRSRTLAAGIDHGGTLLRIVQELLARTEAGRRPVRLLGVGVADWGETGTGQQELFGEPAQVVRHRALDRAVDQLNRRFGQGRIRQASLLVPPVSAPEEGGDSDA